MQASISFHSDTSLPSISSTRLPRNRHSNSSQLATRAAYVHLREADFGVATGVVDDPQRRCLIVARQVVEMVQRPIKVRDLRSAEALAGSGSVNTVLQQKVARGAVLGQVKRQGRVEI